jgi:hypothetical protein
MLNAATARALADLAARANDILHAYDPEYVPAFNDTRGAQHSLPNEDPLAVTVPNGAYFVVGVGGERRYTRDGRFEVRDGALQTKDGADVLGYLRDGREALPQPIRIDSVDAALGRAGDLHIEADGTIAYSRSVIDPRTMQRISQRVVVGTLALARFPAGTDARRTGEITPYLGRPAQEGFGSLRARARALGATDINLGIAKLQEAYLTLRALGAVQEARGELDAGAMDLVK